MPDRMQVRPGSRFNVILKIHKTQTALQKTKQNPSRKIFLHSNFWILMPDRNQVNPGNRFSFILKIIKAPIAL